MLLLAACLLFLFPFAPLARLVSFPAIQPLPSSHLSSPSANEKESTGATLGREPAGSPATSASARSFSVIGKTFSPAGWVSLVYLGGLAAVAAVSLVRYGRLSSKLRCRRQPENNPETLAQYQALCTEFHLRRPPPLYRCEALHSPVLVGPLRPALYLPLRPLSTEQINFALRHELTHHRHRDILLKLAVLCVCALHWCNPLAWLLARAVGENCEAFCDETVAKQLSGSQRCAYASTLLAFATTPGLPQPVSAFASPAKTLQKRLEHLLHPAQPKHTTHVFAVFLAALLVLGGLLAGCGIAPSGISASGKEGNSSPPGTSGSLSNSQALTPPDASSAPASSQIPASSLETEDFSIFISPDNGTPYTQESSFLWPVPSSDELRRDGGPGQAHRGIDIPAEAGTPLWPLHPAP